MRALLRGIAAAALLAATLVLICASPDVSVAQTEPTDPSLLLARALESRAAGKVAQANGYLRELSSGGSPWAERAHYLLAQYHVEAERWEEARFHNRQVMPALSVIGDYVLFQEAVILGKMDDPGAAVETLALLRTRYPRSPLSYDVRLMEAELRLKRFAAGESLDVLAPLLARHDPQAQLIAAEAYLRKGEMTLAEDLCRRLFVGRPGTQFASRAEGMLRAMNRFRFSRSEELERAENLVAAGNTMSAERIYRGFIKQSPKDGDLWEKLGKCLFKGRRYPEAVAALEQAEGEEAAFLQLRARYRSGISPPTTLAAIDDVLRRYPTLDSRMYALRLEVARDYRRQGDEPSALALLGELERHYPSQRDTTRWELAWTHYRKGNLESAARLLEWLRTSDGTDERPRYWRARILDLLGEKKTAKDIYQALASSEEGGYYGLLASMRVPSASVDPRRGVERRAMRGKDLGKAGDEGASPLFHRIEELRLLGMYEEACEEIPLLSRAIKDNGSMLSLMYLCVELGDYHRAISLAQKLGRFHETVLGFEYPRGFWSLVAQTARDEGLDPYLVAAVIREESRFREDAISSAGAIGLMQLLPATALRTHKGAGVPRPAPVDLKSADINIPLGVHYLGSLLKRYDGDLLKSVAAYNAGEAAVDRWLKDLGDASPDIFAEEIPFRETRHYVRKVLSSYRMYRKIWGEASDTPIELVKR